MRRAPFWFLVVTALLAEGIGRAAVPSGAPLPGPVFALVVGVNQPIDPGPPRLLYADDDAILFHKVFSQIGRSILLIDPDPSTVRLHGVPEPRRAGETTTSVLQGVRAPTRANLKAAIGELQALVETSRKKGEQPQLYFVYSGHGDVRNNQGYLALADDRFTARDLAEQILTPSRATANHVIVDACKSYFIIRERRAGGVGEPAPQGFQRTQTLLDRFPNTGFLLSTTSAAASHEWEEFQAGIFSHEVRSGLLGAADINRDGRVSYNEIRAFIEVANSAIRNERYRPSIFVRAPHDDGRAPLLRTRRAGIPALTVPRNRAGRYFLEDSNGVRLADMHTASSGAVTIAVPRDTHLYMHDLSRSVEYLVDPRPGQRQIVALPVRAASHRMKGAGNDAFQRIFTLPFSVPAYKALLRRYAQDDPKLHGTECVRCVCEPCEDERPAPPAPAPPAPPLPAPVAKLEASRSRPAWEPVVEGALGFSLLARSFQLNDPVKPVVPVSYMSGLVPMLGFGIGVYPLAALREGPLRGLGVVLGFRRAIELKSQLPGLSGPVETSFQDFAAGLRYRFGLGGSGGWPRLTLKPGLEGGVQSFSINWADLNATPLPNVSYSYLKIPLDLELALLRSRVVLSLLLGIDYLVVFSGGEIEETSSRGYGSASIGGLDLRTGLELRVSAFLARAGYTYRRVWMSFDNDCYQNGSGCNLAGGALEVSSGFDLLLGFAF
jgi:hypothetical protein